MQKNNYFFSVALQQKHRLNCNIVQDQFYFCRKTSFMKSELDIQENNLYACL